jgi:hypothetical protein
MEGEDWINVTKDTNQMRDAVNMITNTTFHKFWEFLD